MTAIREIVGMIEQRRSICEFHLFILFFYPCTHVYSALSGRLNGRYHPHPYQKNHDTKRDQYDLVDCQSAELVIEDQPVWIPKSAPTPVMPEP